MQLDELAKLIREGAYEVDARAIADSMVSRIQHADEALPPEVTEAVEERLSEADRSRRFDSARHH